MRLWAQLKAAFRVHQPEERATVFLDAAWSSQHFQAGLGPLAPILAHWASPDYKHPRYIGVGVLGPASWASRLPSIPPLTSQHHTCYQLPATDPNR